MAESQRTEQKIMEKARNDNRAASKTSGEMSTEGIQCQEISSNECAVCFGAYEEDLADGEPECD